jgi:hypothetical protein
LGQSGRVRRNPGDRYRNSRLAQGMRGHIYKLKIIFNGIEVLKINFVDSFVALALEMVRLIVITLIIESHRLAAPSRRNIGP